MTIPYLIPSLAQTARQERAISIQQTAFEISSLLVPLFYSRLSFFVVLTKDM